jgi:hypothetical protein
MNALSIVAIYVILDDTLKAMGHQDDCRASLTSAEILTVAVVAARFFQNHHERALQVLIQTRAIRPFSVSRFNRRLHQLAQRLEEVTEWLSETLAQPWLAVIDTFPIPVCRRVRMERCKKVQGKAFLGWCAAKREWFYGFYLHWVCDAAGCPISFLLLPASWQELTLVQALLAPLPPHTCVVGDKAYISADERTLAWDTGRIDLIAKHNARMQPNLPDEVGLLALTRYTIETAHSRLEKMGVQRLHARTLLGFSLKVLASLLALYF